MDINIRDANENDLPKVVELLKELLVEIADTEGLEPEKIYENCSAMLSDKNYNFLIAETESEIAGFINFSTRITCLHRRPSCLIDELIVKSDFRNRGIGEKLISNVVEKCRKIGCCEIEVSTEHSNKNAKAFYKRLGFKDKGNLLELDL